MASNGVANDSILNKRKQSVLSALCKRLSLDPQKISTESSGANDIKDLLSKMTLGDGAPIRKDQEVMSWVAFADTFPVQPEACNESLQRLNDDLVQKSVLLGDGLTPSESDIIVFSAVHSFVSGLSTTERQKYPNVLRWMDYIQNKEDLGEIFEKITVEKTGFEPQKKTVEDNKATEGKKNAPEKEPVVKEVNKKVEDNKAAEVKKKGSEKGPAEKVEENGKKKAPEKEPVGKVKEVSVSLLNIQIGLILKAWKHPSADSLLVEEIDLGDGNICQVVSGLAKYYSPEELTNRKVVLITNVKPGKLRDVMSAGLVLCASNQDHTVVEPLLPPEGAKPGERVSFSGHDGKPDDVLNPKKKQLDKITPFLHTDDKGVATYDGVPFMTSAGPCTSSIPNGSIK